MSLWIVIVRLQEACWTIVQCRSVSWCYNAHFKTRSRSIKREQRWISRSQFSPWTCSVNCNILASLQANRNKTHLQESEWIAQALLMQLTCWMGLNMQSLESCIAMDVNVDDDLLNAILNLISLIAAIDEFMLMQLIQIDQCWCAMCGNYEMIVVAFCPCCNGRA